MRIIGRLTDSLKNSTLKTLACLSTFIAALLLGFSVVAQSSNGPSAGSGDTCVNIATCIDAWDTTFNSVACTSPGEVHSIDDAITCCLQKTSSYPWEDPKKYGDAYECTDATLGFLGCLRSYKDIIAKENANGFEISCDSCDKDDVRKHRMAVVLVDGKWCPYDAQKDKAWNDNRFKECCNKNQDAAETCAGKLYCTTPSDGSSITNEDTLCCKFHGVETLTFGQCAKAVSYCLNKEGEFTCEPRPPKPEEPVSPCTAKIERCIENNKEGKTSEQICQICNWKKMCGGQGIFGFLTDAFITQVRPEKDSLPNVEP